MATYDTATLLEQLEKEVQTVLDTVTHIKSKLDAKTLNSPPESGKWSIAQIVEHLNTYNRYYLTAITQAIPVAKKGIAGGVFKSGWLGEYFTKSMYSEVVTNQNVTNKMKAMKGHIPVADLDAEKVLTEFIKDEQRLLQILDSVKGVNMGSVRIPITISKLIKIKMGDALRFLVAHQVRHLLQINNTLKVVDKH